MSKPTVLIIGGTGYIGYHVCKELIAQNYQVTALSVDTVPENFLPSEVKIIKADLNNISDEELKNLFNGVDYFIFAAGADDRLTPKAPSFPFFYKANVASIERLLTIAKEAKVKKVVVLNSYFAYFNRIWPQMQLAKKHPYIRSRVLQQEMAFKIGGDTMPVAVLELPYIVGVTPTKGSLWQGLVKYVNSGSNSKYYTKGGTAVTSVRNVALAIANALKLTEKNTTYQVVDINMTWEEWLKALRIDKTKDIKVVSIPNFLVKIGAFFMLINYKLKGEEPGLNIVDFIDLQTKNTFLPIEESQQALHYNKYDIYEDFEDTIKLCDKLNTTK